jgi:hypothetical protein
MPELLLVYPLLWGQPVEASQGKIRIVHCQAVAQVKDFIVDIAEPDV